MLYGVLLLIGVVTVLLVVWHRSQDGLRLAELDRERGRVWGMTCAALHKAVQAGLVTGPGAVPPGPLTAPVAVTVAQLKQPPIPPPPAPPFTPFLPAGLAAVDTVGGSALTARFGAVLAGTNPMAVCSLSGADLAERAGSIREGAVMGGLELVGVVGGEDTAMHGRVAAVKSLLAPLADGSLFATADFGIGHRTERLHRRPVGGRPELARMEQSVRFGLTGSIVNVGEVRAEAGETVDGFALGTRTEVGGVASPASLVLSRGSGTPVLSGAGFAFGGVGAQALFRIPGEMAVGTSLASGPALTVRGTVSARSMTVTGQLGADGGIAASVRASAGNLETGTAGVMSGDSARVTGVVTVRNPPCQGCVLQRP